ncbi:MAG: DUF4193 family protein [Acidimicrobiia bacterium]
MASDFDDDLEDDFDDDDSFDDEEEELEDDLLEDDEVDDSIIEDEEDEESSDEDSEDDDEDILDLEEELHPDDVEAPLDALLAERITAGSLDDDEEDEILGDSGTTKVIPRRATEFHCSSCFLVLPNHMLADKKKMLCKDCA